MKKLFFAVLVLVLNLSANANSWKQGESKDFNPMKKRQTGNDTRTISNSN
jgi:hypothetical protein